MKSRKRSDVIFEATVDTLRFPAVPFPRYPFEEDELSVFSKNKFGMFEARRGHGHLIERIELTNRTGRPLRHPDDRKRNSGAIGCRTSLPRYQ